MRLLIALVVCALAGAVPAAAQDVTGTWEASFNTPEGVRPATLKLTKSGDKLTGTIAGHIGEVAVEGTQKGAEITLSFVIDMNGPFPISMTGKLDGDSMTGLADYGGAAQGDWTAKRGTASAPEAAAATAAAVPDVNGAWTLDVQTAAGSGSPTVTFKQDGEKLAGQYNGMFGESPLTGTLKGSEITFAFDVDVQGSTVRIVYTGTVEKEGMKGTVAFGDMAEGTFTGKKK
jgi:hypothetical protein